MADSSLDDFFAKKDKSKKKPKKQIIDPENPADGEAEKKAAKKKKEKSKKKKESENKDAQPTDDSNKEENEWNDFEETTVDLTGLRIAPLQAKQEKEEEEQNGDADEDGVDEDGERRPKTQDGPWQSVTDNEKDRKNRRNNKNKKPAWNKPADNFHAGPPPEPEPVKAATPVVGGKYIPPSRRGLGGASSMGDSGAKASRRKKEAPNIKSDLDFPTLGLGGKPHPADGGGRFEEVRGQGSNRHTEDPSKRTQALELGNKFGALTDSYN